MDFQLSITANINSHEGNFSREIELRSPLTFIVGPNGSGKTHLLKGLKGSFNSYTNKKSSFYFCWTVRSFGNISFQL